MQSNLSNYGQQVTAIDLTLNAANTLVPRAAIPLTHEQASHWFQMMPIGCVVLNAQGEIEACNQAAIDLLDEPLLGEAWISVIERAFAPREDDGCEISLRDGRRISISTQALSQTPGQIVMLSDVTVTREVQAKANRQQRLSAMGKMIASMAHQIRTPLAAAMLRAGQVSLPNLSSEQQKTIQQRLLNELQAIEKQISNMLLFARGGNSIVSQVQLYDVIEQLVSSVEMIVSHNQSHLTVNCDADNIQFHCNFPSVLEALQNIIHNAIEAGGEGVALTLSASIVAQSESCQTLQLTIRDNGPGISKADQEKILEPFYTQKTQGTGLGLAVVHAVAKAHGGEVIIDSELGAGASIGLQLPLGAIEQQGEINHAR